MLSPRFRKTRKIAIGKWSVLGAFCVVLAAWYAPSERATAIDRPLDVDAGICVVVGLPDSNSPDSLVQLCAGNRRLIYFQSADLAQVTAVRTAAATAGVLGSQVFIEHGNVQSLHLADNLADRVWITPAAATTVSRSEILRILHPGAQAFVGAEKWTKPQPEGIDQWSHLYHGPDPDEGQQPTLSALRLSDGSLLWQKSLPALPVKGGLAIDHRKRTVVTLEDGKVLCFAADNE
ncbi:MAG: hypothetical protein ACYC3X_09895 [Pirellulaceae bacterium]